jgi:hypothetical protein
MDANERRYAMTKLAVAVAVALASAVTLGACAPRHQYYDHGYYERGYYDDRRGAQEFDDRDAWEIVRRDPCRYEEYRRYAEKHKNPDKRRKVVWQLARDGCSRGRAYDYDYDRRGYPVD